MSPHIGISGVVVAIYEIGAFVGALSTMAFGERLGRKKTTIVGQAITIIGAALQASSYSLGQMIAARVISGIGVGLLTATVPIWTVSFYRMQISVLLLTAASLRSLQHQAEVWQAGSLQSLPCLAL